MLYAFDNQGGGLHYGTALVCMQAMHGTDPLYVGTRQSTFSIKGRRCPAGQELLLPYSF